jgi:hypothetical protein
MFGCYLRLRETHVIVWVLPYQFKSLFVTTVDQARVFRRHCQANGRVTQGYYGEVRHNFYLGKMWFLAPLSKFDLKTLIKVVQ